MKITNLGPCQYRGTTDKKLEGTQGMELLIIDVDQSATVEDKVGKSLIEKFEHSNLHAICEAGKEPKKPEVNPTPGAEIPKKDKK